MNGFLCLSKLKVTGRGEEGDSKVCGCTRYLEETGIMI